MTELLHDSADVKVELLDALATYRQYTNGEIPIYDWVCDCAPDSGEAEPNDPGTVEYYLEKLNDADMDDIVECIKQTALMLPVSDQPIPHEMQSILYTVMKETDLKIEMLADMCSFLYNYQVIDDHHSVIEFRVRFEDKLRGFYETINATLPADQFPKCIQILADSL